MPEPAQQTDSRPLVSTTSILIFSGFLIGLTFGRSAGDEFIPFLLACGLAGMLAFVGFELARTRRRERQLLREQRSMAARLERHLANSPLDDSEIVPAAECENQKPATEQEPLPQLAD